MKIQKAVITAASPSQQELPLQSIIDRDGRTKSALRVILEEAGSAGVDEICLVICPGQQARYRAAAGELPRRLHFVEQPEARGYGDALLCARDFVGGEPFLHLVSDHLYLSEEKRRCAQQLVEVAAAESCAVSAVQATRENMLPYYGAVGGKAIPNRPGLYLAETVLEKPTPTEAEQRLIVPGLRAAHYLCFFGIHVLTPAVLDLLAEKSAALAGDQKLQLSPALSELAARERFLAFETRGRRFNIGIRFGLFYAQLAFALDGQDREEILAQLLEILASRKA